jgi:ATP-binding cassette, subfamily B, heavy metal transporter
VIFITVALISGVVNNIAPYVYKLIIDAITSSNYSSLMVIVVIFIGVKFLDTILDNLGYYLSDLVFIPASQDIRKAVFEHIQKLDFAYHANKSTGSLISAFKRGDSAFWNLSHTIHREVLYVLIGLATTFFFLGRVDPVFILMLLATFIGNSFIGWKLIKYNMSTRQAMNSVEDEVSAVITDNLINYETVKYFAQEKKESKRLDVYVKDLIKRIWDFSISFRIIGLAIGGLSNLGALVILWLGVNKFIAGQISAGDFIMVAAFIQSFYYQFFGLLFSFRTIAKSYVDIEKYLSILDEKIVVKDPRKPSKIDNIKGEIVFDNVSFSYPDGEGRVLKDVNLKINPGDSIAFVGRSGVGKTTLVKLLLRFFDVTRGSIFIDGVNIKDVTKSNLRSCIGVVPQEPILFDNTIKFNIAYGHKNPTDKEIAVAVEMANLTGFIKSLPKGYETRVGERGIRLSGGQKQRLAIARMILSNPKIIIFDEATSNLDSESERLIQDSLWRVAKDKTVLIIAHRFSTIKKAKKIVVMDYGEIIETGSHQKLSKNKKGIYYYLWQLQTKSHFSA